MTSKPLTVAVVGATGVVGRTMIQVLRERRVPGRRAAPDGLRPLGRAARCRSTGSTIESSRRRPRRSTGSTSPCSRPAATVSEDLAPQAVAHGATVIDNSNAWRMTPGVPLVVSQVNPDDAALHEGIVANPNCSTMQLGAGAHGAARQRRPRAGGRRHLPERVGHRRRGDRRARGPGPGLRRRRAADGVASTRTRSRSTPCPRSTSSSTTATPGRSGRSSPRAARSCTCRTSGSPARPSASRSFTSHSEAVHVETRDPISPERARELFAAVPGVVVQDDPGRHVYPLGDRGRRPRRDLRRPGAPGPVDRRRPRARPVGRERQPAQGRGDERRRDRRAARRPRLGPTRVGPPAPVRPSGARCDGRRARRRARGDRGRDPRLHPLPPPRDARRRRCRGRATRTPRSCSSARARAATRTRRDGRSSAPPAGC